MLSEMRRQKCPHHRGHPRLPSSDGPNAPSMALPLMGCEPCGVHYMFSPCCRIDAATRAVMADQIVITKGFLGSMMVRSSRGHGALYNRNQRIIALALERFEKDAK